MRAPADDGALANDPRAASDDSRLHPNELCASADDGEYVHAHDVADDASRLQPNELSTSADDGALANDPRAASDDSRLHSNEVCASADDDAHIHAHAIANDDSRLQPNELSASADDEALANELGAAGDGPRPHSNESCASADGGAYVHVHDVADDTPRLQPKELSAPADGEAHDNDLGTANDDSRLHPNEVCAPTHDGAPDGHVRVSLTGVEAVVSRPRHRAAHYRSDLLGAFAAAVAAVPSVAFTPAHTQHDITYCRVPNSWSTPTQQRHIGHFIALCTMQNSTLLIIDLPASTVTAADGNTKDLCLNLGRHGFTARVRPIRTDGHGGHLSDTRAIVMAMRTAAFTTIARHSGTGGDDWLFPLPTRPDAPRSASFLLHHHGARPADARIDDVVWISDSDRQPDRAGGALRLPLRFGHCAGRTVWDAGAALPTSEARPPILWARACNELVYPSTAALLVAKGIDPKSYPNADPAAIRDAPDPALVQALLTAASDAIHAATDLAGVTPIAPDDDTAAPDRGPAHCSSMKCKTCLSLHRPVASGRNSAAYHLARAFRGVFGGKRFRAVFGPAERRFDDGALQYCADIGCPICIALNGHQNRHNRTGADAMRLLGLRIYLGRRRSSREKALAIQRVHEVDPSIPASTIAREFMRVVRRMSAQWHGFRYVTRRSALVCVPCRPPTIAFWMVSANTRLDHFYGVSYNRIYPTVPEALPRRTATIGGSDDSAAAVQAETDLLRNDLVLIEATHDDDQRDHDQAPVYAVPKKSTGKYRVLVNLRDSGHCYQESSLPVHLRRPLEVFKTECYIVNGHDWEADFADHFFNFKVQDAVRIRLPDGTIVKYDYLAQGARNSPHHANRLTYHDVLELLETAPFSGRVVAPDPSLGHTDLHLPLRVRKGAHGIALHVDDTMGSGTAYGHARNGLQKYLKHFGYRGYRLKWSKVTFPRMNGSRFGGFEIRRGTESGGRHYLDIVMREEMQDDIKARIDLVLLDPRRTHRELAELAGKLISQEPVLPLVALWLSDLYGAFVRGERTADFWDAVTFCPSAARESLLAQRTIIAKGKARHRLFASHAGTFVVNFTDGSGSRGGGFSHKVRATLDALGEGPATAATTSAYSHWEGDWSSEIQRINSSSFKELKAIEVMTLRQLRVMKKYGASMMTNSLSLFFTDNSPSADDLTTGSARSPDLRAILVVIFPALTEMHADILPYHVSGRRLIKNGTDGFSRADKDIGRLMGDTDDWRNALSGPPNQDISNVHSVLQYLLNRNVQRLGIDCTVKDMMGSETLVCVPPLLVEPISVVAQFALNLDIRTRTWLAVPRRGQNLFRRYLRHWTLVVELPPGGLLNSCPHEPLHLYCRFYSPAPPFLDNYFLQHATDSDAFGPLHAMSILDCDWPRRICVRELCMALLFVNIDMRRQEPATAVPTSIPLALLLSKARVFIDCPLRPIVWYWWEQGSETGRTVAFLGVRDLRPTKPADSRLAPGGAAHRSPGDKAEHVSLESPHRLDPQQHPDGIQQDHGLRGTLRSQDHRPASTNLAKAVESHSIAVVRGARIHSLEPPHWSAAIALSNKLHSRVHQLPRIRAGRAAREPRTCVESSSDALARAPYVKHTTEPELSQGLRSNEGENGTTSDTIPSGRRIRDTGILRRPVGRTTGAGSVAHGVQADLPRDRLVGGVQRLALARDAAAQRILLRPDVGGEQRYFGWHVLRCRDSSTSHATALPPSHDNDTDKDRHVLDRLDTLACNPDGIGHQPGALASSTEIHDAVDLASLHEREHVTLSTWDHRRALEQRRLLERTGKAHPAITQACLATMSVDALPAACRPLFDSMAILSSRSLPATPSQRRVPDDQ